MTSSTVGFIGLGIMGEGMAQCLLRAGFKLHVWNRSPEKIENLVSSNSANVKSAASAAAVVSECDITFCMLSTPDAVKSVYEAETGVLAGISPGKCIVDCATLAVNDMERISAQVLARGGRFLEAPVSGSKGPAANGQLIFLAAGDQALYENVATHLDAMGKAKFFFGAVGQGTRMKLVVNMIMGTMMGSFAEGLSLCSKSGIDQNTLLEVLDLGAIANPMFKLKGPKMISGDHAPNFPLEHAEKDVRLAAELGEAVGSPCPLALQTSASMRKAMDQGHGGKDFSAVSYAYNL